MLKSFMLILSVIAIYGCGSSTAYQPAYVISHTDVDDLATPIEGPLVEE